MKAKQQVVYVENNSYPKQFNIHSHYFLEILNINVNAIPLDGRKHW
jgi:hypothetical protein